MAIPSICPSPLPLLLTFFFVSIGILFILQADRPQNQGVGVQHWPRPLNMGKLAEEERVQLLSVGYEYAGMLSNNAAWRVVIA